MSLSEKIQNMKDDQCIVDLLLKEISGHVCRSCGKCVFGYEGITQLEMILKAVTEKKGRTNDLMLMQELCSLMKTQSMCDDGKEIAQAALTAFENYRSDFEDHIAKRSCRAGICRKFMSYYILPDACTGCTDCIDECDEDAILGKKKFIHVIVQEDCTQCGKCVEACDEDAIKVAGAVKPRCPKKPIPCKR